MVTKVGGAGNDTLTGSNEVDTLKGLGGNDTPIGGKAGDLLIGGSGLDTIRYASSGDAVQINLLFHTETGGDAAGDSFRKVENVTGSAFGDTLFGDSNGNVLRGGTGSDTLFGLAGNDTSSGGKDADRLKGDNAKRPRWPSPSMS
jgi:Ca2+-binding RTX toxin-like protein